MADEEEVNSKDDGDVAVGYNFETKSSTQPSYQCSICMFLIRSCMELKDCGHTFCRECLDRLEQQQQEENEKLQRYIY